MEDLTKNNIESENKIIILDRMNYDLDIQTIRLDTESEATYRRLYEAFIEARIDYSQIPDRAKAHEVMRNDYESFIIHSVNGIVPEDIGQIRHRMARLFLANVTRLFQDTNKPRIQADQYCL